MPPTFKKKKKKKKSEFRLVQILNGRQGSRLKIPVLFQSKFEFQTSWSREWG